jgi:hypothetical protein
LPLKGWNVDVTPSVAGCIICNPGDQFSADCRASGNPALSPSRVLIARTSGACRNAHPQPTEIARCISGQALRITGIGQRVPPPASGKRA